MAYYNLFAQFTHQDEKTGQVDTFPIQVCNVTLGENPSNEKFFRGNEMKRLGKYIMGAMLIIGVAHALIIPIRKVAKDISAYQSATQATFASNQRASH